MRVRTMDAAPLFLAILIAATMLWIPCKCYYKYNTERRMGGKLRHLTRELVLDVEMKIKAVQGYRDQYYKSLQYQLGDIVYEMRNYFKLMVRLYQLSHRDLSYGKGNYHTTIESLLQIQRMAMEIDTKVKMVQGWQYKRETKAEHRIRMLDPLRSRPVAPDSIRDAAVRVRMQQRAGARPPPPRERPPHPAPPAPRGRKNKKWRHVTDDDFLTI